MEQRIYKRYQKEPVIKIKIAKFTDFVDFDVTGEFSAIDDFGNVVFNNVDSSSGWRLKKFSYEPAIFVYSILLFKSKNKKQIEKVLEELRLKNIETQIDVRGGLIILNDKTITDNTHYLLVTGTFNSLKEAKDFQRTYLCNYNTDIVKEKIRELRSVMEIFDIEYHHSAKFINSIRIIPKNKNSEIILKDVLVGGGHKWAFRMDKSCQDPVVFRNNNNGKLIAVADMSLEEYLHGVVPMEMRMDAPIESLKAQVIASRGFAVSMLGLAHDREYFDLCSEPHCQIFGGAGLSNSNVDKAIKETEGEVLFSGAKLCDSFFTPICGGFTNDGSMKEFFPHNTHLSGEIDSNSMGKSNPHLGKEKNISEWANKQLNVYCKHGNQQGKKVREHHIVDNFRWSVTFKRKEIEENIKKYTGFDIGTIYDIIPVKRHKSGHIYEIEIVGSRKNIMVRGDQSIRKACSSHYLASTCFSIDRGTGTNGLVYVFTFTGAGEGEGLGMCQSGAVKMASMGHDYKEILNHYFGTDTLKKLY